MLKKVREYKLGQPFKQCRTVPVAMGPGKEKARAFLHANTPNLDPWTEAMNFPEDTLKLTLISESGKFLWTKDLGKGNIPGIWFEPMISFDLDGDGVDEIWLLDNKRPDLPFTFEHRILERIDPLTGEVTGQWTWPDHTVFENLSEAYRFYIACGYANGEPVLICCQGTYSDEYLQGYGKGMVKLWDIKLDKNDKCPKATHHTMVYDVNHDGIDELFYGERVLSVATGEELYCGDRGRFWAHSDILAPFEDPETGKLYFYSCREGQWEGLDRCERVVTYDDKMNVVWRWPEGGHMHNGWVAATGEGGRYQAMAMSLSLDVRGSGNHESKKTYYYFDAVTGTPIDPILPSYEGEEISPIDVNGDGYSEFVVIKTGEIIDRFEKHVDQVEGKFMFYGKLVEGYNGQQIITSDSENGVVWIYADEDAVEGPCEKHPEYHALMQHMMASGYNPRNACFGI